MKIYNERRQALVAMTLLLLVVLAGCKKDDPSPKDPIKFTWTLAGGSVMQDGVDVTATYNGMTMTFGNETYSTTNAHKLFNSAGAWKWETGSKTMFHLDPTTQDPEGIPVQVSFDGHTLTMTFSMDLEHVNANGRVEAVVGNYVVVLKR